MRLKVGQTAPDFTVQDIDGNTIQLSAYKGKKVLLSFFRNVSCPFCNLRVHELLKLKDSMDKKGVQMLFFFESSSAHLHKSIFYKEMSPIPLIGDPQKKVYAQYGIEASTLKVLSTFLTSGGFSKFSEGRKMIAGQEEDKDATQNLIPADFLLDENQRIVTAHYGANLNDRLPIKDIKIFAGI
jgi:peroxiredoxin Q/BCP